MLLNTRPSGISQLHDHLRDAEVRWGKSTMFHTISFTLKTRRWKLENGRSEWFTRQKMQLDNPCTSGRWGLPSVIISIHVAVFRAQWWMLRPFVIRVRSWQRFGTSGRLKGPEDCPVPAGHTRAHPMSPPEAGPAGCEHRSARHIYSKNLICFLMLFTPSFWKYSIFSLSMIWKQHCTNRTSELRKKTASPLHPSRNVGGQHKTTCVGSSPSFPHMTTRTVYKDCSSGAV